MKYKIYFTSAFKKDAESLTATPLTLPKKKIKKQLPP